MDVDPQTNEGLKKIENILKDRFNGYIILAADGTDVYCLVSSHIFAMGACKYIENNVYQNWNTLEEEEEE